jgi:ACS family hexuronate transporter-like MFS transporter
MDKQPMSQFRWGVVALLFAATTINYLDRQVIGLLKPFIEKDLNWSELDYSHIVIAFSTAYAVGLLFFGRLTDLIGTKLGYTISIIVWSIAAMCHALVVSTFGFGSVRALLGLGESGNFPTAIRAVTEWFPKKGRALATGVFNSGANIGAVAAPAVVPWMAIHLGWKQTFVWTGAIGFLWLVFWWIFYDSPQDKKNISDRELAYIRSDMEREEQESISWLRLFSVRQTWAFFFGKLLTDPVWWFFLFWLPSYFSSTYHLDLKNIGLPLIIVYTATSIGSIGGGWLSSWLIARGWPVFRARKLSMLLFAVCVVPIVFIQYLQNMWVIVAMIGLAAACHQAWSANIYTVASDMFPKNAVSSIIGIGGMAGSVGGILFPLLVGAVLEHYKLLGNLGAGYNIIFVICGCAYLLAWVVMHYFAPRFQPVKVDRLKTPTLHGLTGSDQAG